MSGAITVVDSGVPFEASGNGRGSMEIPHMNRASRN